MSDVRDASASWYALWSGPFLALLLYVPTITGTFLSDDFLVNTMLTHTATPAVDWGEILADFTRSWAGLDESHLYRPLVSVSFGLTYEVGGMNPVPFHIFNVLVHVLGALACAALCATCSPQRSNLAAAVGGALFALHPVAAEPTCWIASRTTGLQVMFAMASMACFAKFLQTGLRSRGVWAATLFLLSLMCKESAVLLPCSFVALDLLIRGRAKPLIAVHTAMFTVVAIYFAMRLSVLGTFIGGDSAGAQLVQSNDLVGILRDKFAMLFVPVGNSLGEPERYVCGAVVMISAAAVLLPALLSRSTRGLCVWGIVWITLYFAPTWRLTVHPDNLGGSRMVYGASGVLAVYLTAVAARGVATRSRTIAIVTLLVGLGSLGIARMVQYLRAYEDMRHLQVSFADIAQRATPEHPLAMVSVNPQPLGIPFLNCNALYPLVEIPVAERDTPLVSMGFVFQPVPSSEHLLFDVGPIRAMREQGAHLLNWPDNQGRPFFGVQHKTEGTTPALPRLVETKPGWFLAGEKAGDGRVVIEPMDIWTIEALEVEVAGDCGGGRVEWLYSAGQVAQEYVNWVPPAQFQAAPRSAPLSRGNARGGSTFFYVDLSHYLTFLALAHHGGLAGFKVVTEGDDCRPVSVRLHARVGRLEQPGRLRGTTVRLGESREHIRAPELPRGAERMTLYIVGPDTTQSMDVLPGPVTLTASVRKAITMILRSSRQKRYYYYFEAKGERTWRSAIDWVRFLPAGS